jgi:hypothetical protein
VSSCRIADPILGKQLASVAGGRIGQVFVLSVKNSASEEYIERDQLCDAVQLGQTGGSNQWSGWSGVRVGVEYVEA